MGKVDRTPASPLQVDLSWDGVIATVTIRGELDITVAAGLKTCLLAVRAEHRKGLPWTWAAWSLSTSQARGRSMRRTTSCKPSARSSSAARDPTPARSSGSPTC